MARVKARIKRIEVDPGIERAVLDFALVQCIDLADAVMTKVETVAKARAPVSSRETTQKVQLRGSHEIPRGRKGSQQEKLRGLFETLEAEGRGGIIRKFRGKPVHQSQKGGKELLSLFRGTRKGGTLKQSPTSVSVQGNALVGTFAAGGHLRDSIHYIGAEIVEGSVIATVVAEADYAAAVHEGFTHRGGRGHSGKATKIPPNPFLSSALGINGRASIGGG